MRQERRGFSSSVEVGEGEEVAGAGVGVLQKALGLLQVFDSDPWSQG